MSPSHSPPTIAHFDLISLTDVPSTIDLIPLMDHSGHPVPYRQFRGHRTTLHRVVDSCHFKGTRHRQLFIAQWWQWRCVVVEYLSTVISVLLLLVLLVEVADGVGLVVDVLV